MSRTAYLTKPSDCVFAATPTRSFSSIFRSRPVGYWTFRQCLQIQTISNFVRFLIAVTLKSRLHFVRGERDEDGTGVDTFKNLLDRTARLLSHVEEAVEKTIIDYGGMFQKNLYLTFDHDLALARGFLFDAAQELAISDDDVISIFPAKMQIIVSAFGVHYTYGSNCYSSLLDKQQRTPWVPDMIDRRHREEELLFGCNSLTNSCREARHVKRDEPCPRNKRCPRALAQEEINWQYDHLNVHLLGSTTGGQTLDTAAFVNFYDLNAVMAAAIDSLKPLIEDNCTCRRCEQHLTFPMRVPLHFLDSLRPPSPPALPAAKRRTRQKLTSPPPAPASAPPSPPIQVTAETIRPGSIDFVDRYPPPDSFFAN